MGREIHKTQSCLESRRILHDSFPSHPFLRPIPYPFIHQSSGNSLLSQKYLQNHLKRTVGTLAVQKWRGKRSALQSWWCNPRPSFREDMQVWAGRRDLSTCGRGRKGEHGRVQDGVSYSFPMKGCTHFINSVA